MGGMISFDYSCALEMLNFNSKDAKEGLESLMNKRNPIFPTSKL